MACPSSCRTPGCTLSYREHLLSVNISAHATPSRRPRAVQVDQTEARWDKDMPAYKRLRGSGLQPAHIDGSAELESRASDRFEVEMGHLVPDKDKPRIREGLEMAKELTA